MFNPFNKDKYRAGFMAGLKKATDIKNREIHKIKKKAAKIISDKNDTIKKTESRVDDIECALEEVAYIFSRMKYMASIIDDEQEQRFQHFLSIHAQDENILGTIKHLCRTYEKKLPAIVKKIDRFKIESVA
jgi:hypothetical protein